MRTVLLTGASGFIGRHLSRDLTDRGHTVRGLVRGGQLIPDIDVFPYEGLHDREAIRAAAEGAQVLVHLAARVHVMRDTTDDALGEYRRVNVEGSRSVVEEAIAAGVQLVILLSSVKAVGEESGDEPWDETTPPAPVDPYGRSKLEAEEVVLQLARAAGIEAVVLRVPLVYGAGMRGNMLQLVNAIRRGVPLPFGRIDNRRSLLYVGNLTAAIAEVIGHERTPSGVYFLSDGRDLSSAQLVRAVAAGLNKRPRLIAIPTPLLGTLGRLGDFVERAVGRSPITSRQVNRLMGSLRISSERFRRQFSFEPAFKPEEGLERTVRAVQRP